MIDQKEIDRRVETLFRCLSQSSKSPLSAIRSAVEALIGYPEMAPEKRDAFQKIIYQESLTLTAILDRLADECAGLVGDHRAPDGDGPVLPVPEIGGKLNGPDAAHLNSREEGAVERMMIELCHTALIRETRDAGSVREIAEKRRRLPEVVSWMLSAGTAVRNITRFITAFSDAAIHRLMELAVAVHGPPPVPFAFITFGSEGRKEQTLNSDQDNAIIFHDDANNTGTDPAETYFLPLGETVCEWLDTVGYRFCDGGVMAQNRRCCQPLSAWERCFSDWIIKAGPADLLHSSIFFDFRWVYGDPSLVAMLQQRLFRLLDGWSGFFRRMTENAIRFKPPIGVFRHLGLATLRRRNRMLDLKAATTPFVDVVRVYALRHGIRETNTHDRLYGLCRKKILSRKDYAELEQAYSFLMQLRFLHQITAEAEPNAPPNCIRPRALSGIEQKMLKEAFKRIERFQARARFDFIGISVAP